MSTVSHKVATCPFYRRDYPLKLNCECGRLTFPDKEAAHKYIEQFCASDFHWRSCPLAVTLFDFYERNEHGKQN